MAFSYFFRKVQVLETIHDHVVPTMRAYCVAAIWIAGSAIGQESYSLVMLLQENMDAMIFHNIYIIASDIDLNDQFGPIIRQGYYLALEHTQKLPAEVAQLFQPVTTNTQLFRKRSEIAC